MCADAGDDLPTCEVYQENQCEDGQINTDPSFEDHRWYLMDSISTSATVNAFFISTSSFLRPFFVSLKCNLCRYTPVRGTDGWVESFQDYSNLVGFSTVQYDSDSMNSATVSVTATQRGNGTL